MVDRLWVWLSAGVVTAGMTAAMLAGTGVAIADDGSPSDAGASKSSQTSNSTDGKKDSPTGAGRSGAARSADGADSADPKADPKDDAKDAKDAKDDATDDATDPDNADVKDPKDDEETTEEEATEEEATDDTATDDTATSTDDDVVTAEDDVVTKARSNSDHTTNRTSAAATADVTAPTSDEDTTVTPESEKKAVIETDLETATVQPPVEQTTTIALDKVVEHIEEPEVQAVAFASAPLAATATATAPQLPGIIRVIGTIVFDLYAIATRIFGGPPILPPNSTVTVRSSSLRIDCACEEGEGQEVPADWYIPKTEEGKPPPDRLIYLQHGFLASGPWYSHTAAALAEQTNSIVVAPSITSNFFAADACWLGGAPMHEAMAGLLDEDNTALLESARAAGYNGPIPDRVVLMGHSLGGGAVSGMAGHMVDDGTVDRLAGVVLLDGVALGDPARMTASLKKVPLDIPIYQLAAPVYMWNNFGAGLDALVAARPGEFVGVTLVNGSHVDTMRGGNPLIQFAQELVAGFTQPENAAAAQMLMVGWVNDMFAGNKKTGIYLELGEQFSFDTPAGEASVVALPNTLTKPFWLNFLQPFMSLANGFFTFDPVCVGASVGTSGVGNCSDTIAA
ncbi:alpha/beta hydrolase [Mycobacterium sp. IS-3022]|uniref:alpha/beta hydrolase family protein n=1 Tax=Mycobacterium sp. IS-3022 TaxID=1772277 RepID=UPI000741642B|nr:alpha/beta hydrolase [Mycobacterium sp. IS-3022]KUH95707.1 hypothetical protein AU188_20520 [Mycobacterium sp. IS-3022]